ncbi:hypothetical protein TNCV_3132071 [Trichonephila clavipes]|uniref:Uncharacterized protein n=1 Tax=Trichonephila clavipes TaxID=2585209 RepID=A0A8X6RYG6_TRICX|nr:hypothetical protein TNCV_3132071 [Trichonephila clavipes]
MSSFLGFCDWNTRNRWRDGQVCPDVDKELWRLGPDGSVCVWRWTSVSRCGQGTMAPWARWLGRGRGKDEGWSFEEAERRIPEFFYPCCCPRVENADEKQRLADWTETSGGVSDPKTGSTILARHGNYQLLNLTKINFPIGEKKN